MLAGRFSIGSSLIRQLVVAVRKVNLHRPRPPPAPPSPARQPCGSCTERTATAHRHRKRRARSRRSRSSSCSAIEGRWSPQKSCCMRSAPSLTMSVDCDVSRDSVSRTCVTVPLFLLRPHAWYSVPSRNVLHERRRAVVRMHCHSLESSNEWFEFERARFHPSAIRDTNCIALKVALKSVR